MQETRHSLEFASFNEMIVGFFVVVDEIFFFLVFYHIPRTGKHFGRGTPACKGMQSLGSLAWFKPLLLKVTQTELSFLLYLVLAMLSITN